MKRTISIRVDHCCAFCQHWYDPMNSAIRPIRPQNAVWEYDEQEVRYCQKMRLDRKADRCCKDFAGKIQP